MRVFLDANILFSAAQHAGAIRHLLDRLLEEGHECIADTYVVEEARRNIARKSPAAMTALEDILKAVRVEPAFVGPSTDTGKIPLPEKDIPVLLAAIRLKCDWLVTGDQTHFGPLYGLDIMGVTVCSPRMLAEKLRL